MVRHRWLFVCIVVIQAACGDDISGSEAGLATDPTGVSSSGAASITTSITTSNPTSISATDSASGASESLEGGSEATIGTGPVFCGDGVVDDGEACDLDDLGGANCASVGEFAGGDLACSDRCTFDTSACNHCGDNTVQMAEGEVCDGVDLADQTCSSLGRGFTGGTLACTPSCTFDTAGCNGLPAPAMGELIVSEIMQNPATVGDPNGEWFEIHNPSATTGYTVSGCSVEGGGAREAFVIDVALAVGPGGFLTFADQSATGPGFVPDFSYGGFSLTNTVDTIRLVCGGATIDEVTYGDSSFPHPSGAAMNLDPLALDAVLNDSGMSWCEATASYNGDLGTPGAANTSCGGDPSTASLYFTEYVEGSGNNKALEIVNANPSVAANLAGCAVRTYFGGNTTAGSTITLTGSLGSGDTFVVCDNDATVIPAGTCDLEPASTFFNGDDAIELACGGVTIDVIGRVGEDPGVAWGSGNVTTQDRTLRRNCTVTAGDPDGSDAFDPALEWSVFATDDVSDLGVYVCSPS